MTLTLSEHDSVGASQHDGVGTSQHDGVGTSQVEETLDETERGDAYAEGWDAAEAGASRLGNPYPVDSNKHTQWHRGWKDWLNSPESALANSPESALANQGY